MSNSVPSKLALRGVDHTARPTWKLKQTVEFYRDILGLPLIHVISARGWGPVTHPDFLHFFFDSGNGSTIAFFYYLGSDAPESLEGRNKAAPVPEDHVFDATHTAWLVDSTDELQAWKQRLEEKGLNVSAETTHEVIESIYVRDPNGYFIEFTRKLRPLVSVDAEDAALTLQAAIDAEAEAETQGRRVIEIDEIWNKKADLIHQSVQNNLRIYVPKVDEFSSLVRNAKEQANCKVITSHPIYDVIESDVPVEFRRKELGLKPAVWWGLFTGGIQGRIEAYDRDHVRIVPSES
ncbi:VOC family protein [Acinetobacter dispersus]|uniref:VOC domain-containing protein n=1 Tax=Acinetobacter dispersus TaxID=70348 RepID=N9MZB2_9GAMM|nr:VOC family protein [Acinetobacter dispersus]ENW95194.1 hypothetical protein F904_00485 [Acinetobacter dispersus]